jgi:hypothetical protein
MPSSAYYRKQAELYARLALVNISDPSLVDQYSMRAREYRRKADEADLTGPMPPPETLSPVRGIDHD